MYGYGVGAAQVNNLGRNEPPFRKVSTTSPEYLSQVSGTSATGLISTVECNYALLSVV
ncbi:MAG TPA: hypothetical protein VFC84_18290 [Desulfosporosinus sp.]|nr:hypothetical protein [Desulfosporosinus sp.]